MPTLESGTPASVSSRQPAKVAKVTGAAAARTSRSADPAPQPLDPKPTASDTTVTALPLMPASTSAPSERAVTSRADDDPRSEAIGGATAPESGRAQLPDGAASPTPVPTAAMAPEAKLPAAAMQPDGAPSPTPPQAATTPPPSAAVASIAATPAMPLVIPSAKSSAVQAAAPAPVSTPAAQIAPPLISVAQSASGTHRLTIRLDPPELGTVQIRVERPADAPTQVEINVQRPETLSLLLRDQPHLQHALDQAGVPTEGRTLSFQLDPQDQRGTPGDPGGSQGRRAPTHQPTAQQMQADPDDLDDPDRRRAALVAGRFGHHRLMTPPRSVGARP